MADTIDWAAEEDDEKLAAALQAQVDALENSPYEHARRQALLYDLELYLGVKLSNLYQLNGVDFDRAFSDAQQIAFNVCYSIPNTIHNRICSFRPRAQFIPDGGDFRADDAAKDWTDMSDAWAREVDWQGEASFAFRDRLTGDGGISKVYVEQVDEEAKTAKVGFSRFPSWEFMFDEAEAIYREPECGYHSYYLPVEQASRQYGVDVDLLRRNTVSMPQGIVYVQNRPMVRIIDAYARGPGGKHVIVCGPQVITPKDQRAWEWDGFPFVGGTFDRRPIGKWGDGAVKRLRAIQLELIEWQNSMRKSHGLTSMQVWQVQENEQAPTKITNDYVRIERYTNTPANVLNPAAANAEMYQYYKTLEDAGYKVLGVSPFIAAGVKQPGITAAVAIRESSEMQTDRLSLLSQEWEKDRVDSAIWWRRMCTKLVQDGFKLQYRAIRRGSFVTLKMDDVEREMEIGVYPSSLFGQTVSGRLQKATELISSGFIDKEDAMKALDIPDLGPITDLALAERYAMEALVDDLLRDGKFVMPDPQIDPVKMYDYARKRYLLAIAKKSNYPDDNMAKMRRLLAAIKPAADAARQAAAAPPAPAAPALPGVDVGNLAGMPPAPNGAAA